MKRMAMHMQLPDYLDDIYVELSEERFQDTLNPLTWSELMDLMLKDYAEHPQWKISPHVVPYCDALWTLNTTDVNARYFLEDARGLAAYWLNNAMQWRGPVARAVKAEIKRRLNAAR